MDEFWSRRGARTLGLRRTFDFIIQDRVLPPSSEETEETIESLQRVLAEWLEARNNDKMTGVLDSEDVSTSAPVNAAPSSSTVLSHADIQRLAEEDARQEDAVFLKSYIPRTLNDVYDPERDVGKMKRGEGKDLIYGNITGVLEANPEKEDKTVRFVKGVGGDEDEDEASDDDGSEDEETDEEGGERAERVPRGHRHEDKDAKKVLYRLTTRTSLSTLLTIRYRRGRKLPRRKHERSENIKSQRQRKREKSSKRHHVVRSTMF